MNVPFVDLGSQYQTLRQEVNQAIEAVIASSQFILGEEVRLFEREFADFCETKQAIGIDTGTSALELALRAMGVGPGDEVITPANTFIATVLAILAVGAKPVLVDIDPLTYNISVSGIEQAITDKTRVILPVHLYGQPADMAPILNLAEEQHLMVLEDACQAHGAYYDMNRAGSMGEAAAFSFYPAKNLGCYGDGGMVVTNSEQIAENVRMLRNYGQKKKYEHLVMGYNRRLDSVQAAVLRIKLRHLDAWNAARRKHARLYDALLDEIGVTRPFTAHYAEHAYHLYVIRTTHRDALQQHLQERGIGTGIHYPIPIHLQPACRDLGYQPDNFPVTEQCAAEILSLPMFAELTDEQIKYVVESIHDFISEVQPEAQALA